MTDADQWIFMREGCQWIGSDQHPSKGKVSTCGAKVKAGKTYCEEHYEIAYKKPPRKKKAKFKLPEPRINF
jgi:hypothetical protein